MEALKGEEEEEEEEEEAASISRFSVLRLPLHTSRLTVLRLPTNLYFKVHKALPLPQFVHFKRVQRNLRFKVHRMLRLIRNPHIEVLPL